MRALLVSITMHAPVGLWIDLVPSEHAPVQPWEWTIRCSCDLQFCGRAIRLGGAYAKAREAIGKHQVTKARENDD